MKNAVIYDSYDSSDSDDSSIIDKAASSKNRLTLKESSHNKKLYLMRKRAELHYLQR